MKKTYMIPAMYIVSIVKDDFLLVLSGGEDTGDMGDDPIIVDAREEKSFEGNNLWDEEW